VGSSSSRLLSLNLVDSLSPGGAAFNTYTRRRGMSSVCSCVLPRTVPSPDPPTCWAAPLAPSPADRASLSLGPRLRIKGSSSTLFGLKLVVVHDELPFCTCGEQGLVASILFSTRFLYTFSSFTNPPSSPSLRVLLHACPILQ